MRQGAKEQLKTLIAVCFWIAVWWVAAALAGKPLLLPAPPAVIAALWSLLGTPEFWTVIGTSLGRVLLGVVSATAAGIVFAALCERFSPFRAAVQPLMTVIKSTPVASFTILVLLWLRRDAVPAFIAALIVLPVVWANVSAGIRGTDPQLLELSRACRLSPWRTLRRIRVPSVLPSLRAALRSALGFGWKAGVAAEVLTLPRLSIGRMIYETKLYLQTEELFAWTAAVVLLSLAIEKLLLRLLEPRRAPSRVPRRQPGKDADTAADAAVRSLPAPLSPPAGDPVLAAEQLSAAFGERPVFSGLDLTLAPGERLALMGPSGCGKTTLLRIAAGVLQPSDGTVRRGTDRIAVCFQEPRLLPWRTAAENVNLVLSDTRTTLPEAEAWLALLGITREEASLYPSALSGGMQQRAALARALAQRGALLLLDEPFKALDAALRTQVIDAVSGQSAGAAILLVTHDEAEAEALGCRVRIWE